MGIEHVQIVKDQISLCRLFFMLNLTEHEKSPAGKVQITIPKSLLLNIAEDENFSANKYENANYIFIFISRENFMLS